MTESAMEPAIAAVLRLTAERGWRSVSLQDVAAAVDVPLTTLRREFPCKTSLLVAYAQAVERRAAADPAPFEPDDTVRDRLFELLMQRLDILEENRHAVTGILRDLPSDPLGAAVAGPEVLRLMAAILDRAGVRSDGPIGLLRCQGLAGIWLATLYVWARDDSPDHARTMAALDGNLRRAEPVARLLSGLPFGGGPAAAPGGY
jgi:AcrR family transcriptional regulator